MNSLSSLPEQSLQQSSTQYPKMGVTFQLVSSVLMALSFFEETNCPFSTLLLLAIFLSLFLISFPALSQWQSYKERPKTRLAIVAFSLAAALSTAAGGHVIRNAWFYDGHYQDNFMGPWEPLDALWCLMLAGFMASLVLASLRGYHYLCRNKPRLCHRAYTWLKTSRRKQTFEKNRTGAPSTPAAPACTQPFLMRSTPAFKHTAALFVIAFACLFICWLPYFLQNYPAALYADSLESIRQALSLEPLENHHPVVYTLVVGAFLYLGEALGGGYQLGVALYALVQMAFVAAGFAYSLTWLNKHRLARTCILVIGTVYALFPIFPLHAVSMWKDAPYATFMLLFALEIFEVVLSRGEVLHRPTFLARLSVLSLGICFMRNNGFFVVVACFALLVIRYMLIPWHKNAKIKKASGATREATHQQQKAPDNTTNAIPGFHKRTHRCPHRTHNAQKYRPAYAMSIVALALCGFYLTITGPVYQAAHVVKVPVESYAVPLEQVSSVVVYDGELSAQERTFANALLPLEDYKERYIPCSVDGIKWAKNFNTTFFDEHQQEFLQTWFAVGLKNPKLYFDAYVLETYEYWSMGDVQRSFTINGVNTKHYDDDLGISAENLLEQWFGPGVNNLFPFSFVYPCEGVTSWFLLFIALLTLCWHKRRSYVLVLMPALASWATLLISAPFAGLHRYILASEFLLPLAIVFPLVIAASEFHRKESTKKIHRAQW